MYVGIRAKYGIQHYFRGLLKLHEALSMDPCVLGGASVLGGSGLYSWFS